MINRIKARANGLCGAAARFRNDASGVAAIEFAAVFPFMLVLYFGVVDVTELISANRKVTLATSAVGDLVAQAPGVITEADLNGLYKAIGPIMEPIPASAVKIEILVYKKSGASSALRWTHVKNGTCTGSLPSGMASMMADGNDLVVARVCTNYQPITGKVIGAGPFALSDQFVLRPREAPQLVCTDC
jgi:TadE-like protein